MTKRLLGPSGKFRELYICCYAIAFTKLTAKEIGMREIILLLLLLFSTSAVFAVECDWGTIDDSMASRFIDDSLLKYGKFKPLAKIEKSYLFLKNKRRTSRYCDYDLAAAEHYMYARFVTATTGDNKFDQQIRTYDFGKRILDYIGKLDAAKTTKLPVSPPSDQLLAWGLKGAKKGLQDYKEINPGASFNPGSAKSIAKSLAKKLVQSQLDY